MVVIPSSGVGAREGIVVGDELGDELAWLDGEGDGLIDGASVVGGADGAPLGMSVILSTSPPPCFFLFFFFFLLPFFLFFFFAGEGGRVGELEGTSEGALVSST